MAAIGPPEPCITSSRARSTPPSEQREMSGICDLKQCGWLSGIQVGRVPYESRTVMAFEQPAAKLIQRCRLSTTQSRSRRRASPPSTARASRSWPRRGGFPWGRVCRRYVTAKPITEHGIRLAVVSSHRGHGSTRSTICRSLNYVLMLLRRFEEKRRVREGQMLRV
jgi:hypothetical protein